MHNTLLENYEVSLTVCILAHSKQEAEAVGYAKLLAPGQDPNVENGLDDLTSTAKLDAAFEKEPTANLDAAFYKDEPDANLL